MSAVIILHLSKKLAEQLRCDLSFENFHVAQPGRMDSWSADLFQLQGLGSLALVMHDASLWPILITLAGRKSYADFLQELLLHIEASYLSIGGNFDRSNLTVVATRRSNRRIIGSMNEAKYLLEHRAASMVENFGVVDWVAARQELSQTPFGAVEGHFPDKRFAQLVAKEMHRDS